MRLDDLQGLITPEVGKALARHAALVPPGLAIVELGSFKGKSTCYLASTTENMVYAIDAWDLPRNVSGRFRFHDAYEMFLSQTRHYPNITPIKAYSTQAASDWTGGVVGLLFIDADHSEAAVWNDVMAWLPHLTPTSTVILDDWGTPRNPGVARAADRLVPVIGPYVIEAGRLAVFSP